MTKLFPCILMILNICASITYLYYGDWKKSIYWVSACVLTATVTF